MAELTFCEKFAIENRVKTKRADYAFITVLFNYHKNKL